MQTSAISFKTSKSSIKKGGRSVGKDFSDSDHKVRNDANLTVDTMQMVDIRSGTYTRDTTKFLGKEGENSYSNSTKPQNTSAHFESSKNSDSNNDSCKQAKKNDADILRIEMGLAPKEKRLIKGGGRRSIDNIELKLASKLHSESELPNDPNFTLTEPAFKHSKIMQVIHKKIQPKPGDPKNPDYPHLNIDTIKDLYTSIDGTKMTSTLINIDIEEMCFCLASAIRKHIDYFWDKIESDKQAEMTYDAYPELGDPREVYGTSIERMNAKTCIDLERDQNRRTEDMRSEGEDLCNFEETMGNENGLDGRDDDFDDEFEEYQEVEYQIEDGARGSVDMKKKTVNFLGARRLNGFRKMILISTAARRIRAIVIWIVRGITQIVR
jgi:hypothetical protein